MLEPIEFMNMVIRDSPSIEVCADAKRDDEFFNFGFKFSNRVIIEVVVVVVGNKAVVYEGKVFRCYGKVFIESFFADKLYRRGYIAEHGVDEDIYMLVFYQDAGMPKPYYLRSGGGILEEGWMKRD